MTTQPRPRLLLMAAAFALVAMTAAHADGGSRMPRDVPAAYTQECASCHTAYPPGMLPARSWQRVMTGLDKHYGTDASLETAAVQPLSTWLQANAGTYKRVREEPPQDRITRSAWFERKHGEIDPSVWKLASVKSAANCAACHTGTERGVFSDHKLQTPAGLDARSRRAWND